MSGPFPTLDPKIGSRSLIVSDLDIHILEARPPPSTDLNPPRLIVLLHGFPEIAYSWRHIIVPLSNAGYHVVAPDQRGYGRTKQTKSHSTLADNTRTHEKVEFPDDLAPYRILNLATDIVSLVFALGYTSAAAVIGHDFGSPVAGLCALIRPGIFRRVVMMSAPYSGPTPPPHPTGAGAKESPFKSISEALASLTPPRKHYTAYFSTPEANNDMLNPPQGLHAFLRAYFHMKGGNWTPNKVAEGGPLQIQGPGLSSIIAALASLPEYYVMPLSKTMPETVLPYTPSPSEVEEKSGRWLSDDELAVYVSEYGATGFQGGLNRYRCATADDGQWEEDLRVFSGKKIEVPAMFIAGRRDWGTWQLPGAAERMRRDVCVGGMMREDVFVLIEGAGHWVQQEKPKEVVECLLRLLGR